ADGLFPIRSHRALVPATEAAAWADQESDRPKIGHQPAAAAFSFWRADPDLHRCAPQSRVPNRRFGGFRSESRTIEYQSASRRPIVYVGRSDREQWQEVVRGSLICSQFKSYENEISDTRTNISPVKKSDLPFRRRSKLGRVSSKRYSAAAACLPQVALSGSN